jgi:hypothetical protein
LVLEDGSFIISHSIDSAISSKTSKTSSTRAEIGSIPDINALPEDNLSSDTLVSSITELLGRRSELDGAGCWQSSEHFMPWRSPVGPEDLGQSTSLDETSLKKPPQPSKSLPRSKKTRVLPQISKWVSGTTSESVAESTESLPELTDGSSRDTDNHELLEPLTQCDVPQRIAGARSSAQDFRNMGCFAAASNGESPILRAPNHFTVDEAFSGTNHIHEPTGMASSTPACTVGAASHLIIARNVEDTSSTLSSEDYSDDDSEWMSDYSESIPRLEDGHPFLAVMADVVRQALLAYKARVNRPCDSNSGSASGSTAVPTSTETSGKQRKRTSKHTTGSDGAEGGEHDDPDVRKKRTKTAKQAVGRQVSLACPYAKKDAIRYRGCHAYVIKRIQDVKSHLSRYHQLPIYCQRCKMIFQTETARDEHAETIVCEVNRSIVYEGVTRAQKSQLGQRVSARMTLEDQWFTIFDILFPGHQPRPNSPYINVDLTVDLEAFQDMMFTEGPNIIISSLASRGIQTSTIANEERDLSVLLQMSIFEGLQAIAQRWLSSLGPAPSAGQQDRETNPASTISYMNEGPSVTGDPGAVLTEHQPSQTISSQVQPLTEIATMEASDSMRTLDEADIYMLQNLPLPQDSITAMPVRTPSEQADLGQTEVPTSPRGRGFIDGGISHAMAEDIFLSMINPSGYLDEHSWSNAETVNEARDMDDESCETN